MKFIILLTSLFFAFPSFADQDSDAKKLDEIMTEITELNENLSCSKAADCDALPTGNALCGGPGFFIVVSKKNKKLEDVRKKIDVYTDAQMKYQEQHQKGMAGICAMMTKPAVKCLGKRCRKA